MELAVLVLLDRRPVALRHVPELASQEHAQSGHESVGVRGRRAPIEKPGKEGHHPGGRHLGRRPVHPDRLVPPADRVAPPVALPMALRPEEQRELDRPLVAEGEELVRGRTEARPSPRNS